MKYETFSFERGSKPPPMEYEYPNYRGVECVRNIKNISNCRTGHGKKAD